MTLKHNWCKIQEVLYDFEAQLMQDSRCFIIKYTVEAQFAILNLLVSHNNIKYTGK